MRYASTQIHCCFSLYFAEWTEDDVIDKYLKPIGMDFMSKAFKESKITGPVLMALTEKHMKELGCCVLGEYLMRLIFSQTLLQVSDHAHLIH